MSRQDNPQSQPNFDAPIEFVADPSLSKQEKAEALEDLEQNARQLAIASGEGERRRADGARRSSPCERGVELLSTDFAYELVLKALEA